MHSQPVSSRSSVFLAASRASLLAAILAVSIAVAPAWALNPIATENALTGNPPSEWDVTGAGDLSIQGFATDISVNRGGTVHFKVDTDAATFGIKIYRLGYYQGNGARLIADLGTFTGVQQTTPAPDPTTGLVDCGTWSESASWSVPAGAVSGIYLARLQRTDTQGASHIAFIVRDDSGTADLLFKTSDATWQAYNVYGGNSLYVGTAPFPSGHAAKVSYNRPFVTRNGGGGSAGAEDWLFDAEYPMLRWLEANGYDMAYTTDVDMDRDATPITPGVHRVLMSVGHDEYWSAAERAKFEAARNSGVHLAFFSGNEIYWKTRWENSTDGSNTPHRTLVCYKEGTLGENACGGKCDPLATAWTGLWRDGCLFTPPADGCNPENALSGQISWDGNTAALQVPDTYKNLRLWRNTSVAALGVGETATFTPGTLGYEWDWEQYPASYPPARILLSSTTLGGRTHHLSLYRHASGALVFGAGTVQWSWGLDSVHDRGSDPPSPAMQQATVNLLADMGVQPETLQPGMVAATMSSDATAPTSAITFPIQGANLTGGAPLTVAGTASDAGGELAGVEVSVDGGATWQRATGTTSWTYAWTPLTAGATVVKSRGFDDSGNLQAAGTAPAANAVAVTVTEPPPQTCPCTVFQPGDAPASAALTDGQPIEVGMKFRSTVDGFVTGVRFYKGALNTGTHVGHLWTRGGAQLAQVVFAGETASGWQEEAFPSPVAITANTTYVISYHSTGYYADTHPYFTSPVVNNPLRGLGDGEDGPNGVYAYGEGGFPTSTYDASNYWVDAVFDTTVGPDVAPPIVAATSPGAGASGVAIGATVTVTFNEAMDAPTIDATTIELRDGASALVPSTVSYNAAIRTASLAPTAPLAYSTSYTLTVRGGATDPRVKDLAGNPMASDFTASFTTSAPPAPPPDEGPGGPILVLSSASNPFSRYPVEILRAEGLNAFTARDVSTVDATALAAYDVVILGEMTLSPAQVTLLTDWTNAGGTLIALRPDAQLAGLLGLTPAAGTLADEYLLVDTGSAPGAGIVGETIQFHGTADLYTLSGATSIATLYSDATTSAGAPAVTTRAVGANGGRAVAFTYDLARSVVYTRQGNPAWAGQERDGVTPRRSDDLFYGAATGDPQPDWIDLSKVAIPQADEQQRLLANLILQGNLHRKPLPRFWYLPKGLKAAVVMTGDDHGDAGMQPRFDIYRNESASNCSVDDWECVRATGYLYVGSTFTPAQAQFYDGLGFEVALHVNTDCGDWTPASLDADFTSQLATFGAAYPGIAPPGTNRTHCIAWSDWSTQADVQVAHGIRLDTNYYYWPPGWVQNRPGLFTGSGMPMRFARTDGTLVDCYQAVTQMTDESGQTYPMTADSLLNRALDARGFYGAFVANMHFDSQDHAGSNAIVASAQARGVPVVSAKQMLTWLDGRNGSSFGNLGLSGDALSFSIAVAAGARNLRAMLPTAAAAGQLASLTRNGSPVATTVETIKGIEYAFFPAEAGDYVATYVEDATPPIITSVTATPGIDGTSATVAWTTDEPATSRVDYGTAPASLTLSASSAALTTAHDLGLTGLTPNTTYYYRVTSADAVPNSATEPPLASSPLSFTTLGTPCATDATAADFAAGTPGAATYVSETANGEVILTPTEGAEFSGTTLPAGWTATNYSGGGSAVVSGGHVSVDGAFVATSAFYGPGRSVECVATFDATANGQHLGFGNDLNASPWAIFSTHAGGVLEARTNGGSEINEVIAGSWLGAPHRFRVDWKTDSLIYWIDDARVAAHVVTIGGTMRPIVSDGPVGGNPLQADWVRLTPFAASGSYTSRVFDAGGPATWGLASWSSSTPAGTSVSLLARRGNTPAPDGTWTGFVAIPSPGSDIAGSGRYLQYRADLATGDVAVTPALQDVTIQCDASPDVTAPVISDVAATPAGNGLSANVTWTTDEPASSRVDYGTSPGSLTLNVASGSLVTSHNLALNGLTPNTTYYYRVTSADAVPNSATFPDPPAAPLSFTTPANCPADAAAADFELGALDAGTAIALAGDGEIILSPALAAEFTGTSVPAGWHPGTWNDGGTVTVGGGLLTVDGGHASSDASFGPGRSMEFVATYSPANFQNIGFAADSAFNSPWVVIGEGSSTDGVYARTSTGASVLLSSSTFGAPHRYRIDWNAGDFVFYVDGAQVATLGLAVGGSMVAMVSDLNAGGGSVAVDWLRVTPYASAGSFTSRVFDGGGPTNWGVASWSSSAPSGTSLSILARSGNTPAPDGSWSAFEALSNGVAVGGNTRYLQYRADLATTQPSATPALQDIAVACVPGPDATAPTITNVVATPALDGTSATITWSTDEPADSRVDYGTSPGTLGSNATSGTRVRSHGLPLTGLTGGVTYYYRVTSADAAANATTEPPPPGTLSFSTPAPACLTDQTDGDFAAGTTTDTYVSSTSDGEVILAPTAAAEFSGSALPAGWTGILWSDGSPGGSTVSGGSAIVDGGRLTSPDPPRYGPGRVLEFVATFAAAAFQHVGFGDGDNSTGSGGMFGSTGVTWAMFSTGTSAGPNLFARLNPGGDVNLGTGFLGSPHRYRIEWRADSVVFMVDGASLDRRAAALATPMRFGASDFDAGGATLSVDWARITPYAASGTFRSRVYDAGVPSTWDAMTWTASVPSAATLALSVRKGNTPAPDGTWTPFAPVAASGSIVGGTSRYIQYQADLGTGDPSTTPVLEDVQIACGPCAGSTPAALTDLSAIATGNAGGGRAFVRLSWSGVPAGEIVKVYRRAYGDYPLYRSGPGAEPAVPATPQAAEAAGWDSTTVHAPNGLDAPPSRGFWYYVAFVSNDCALTSAPSNRTGGTLDYLLGDVSDGIAVCVAGGETGDGEVSTSDLSALGASYGQSFGPTDDRICLDVGPTVDLGLRSRPAPDGFLGFEDLVLYALNFEVPLPVVRIGPPALAQVKSDRDELSLTAPSAVSAGATFEATLHLIGSGAIHALSTRLAWDPAVAELVGFSPAGLVAASGGVVLSPHLGQLDLAVLGRELPGFSGEGDLVKVAFRALRDGDPGVRLAQASARDADNHPLTLGGVTATTPVSYPTRMGLVFPNPFRGSLQVSFSLAREARAKVLVFDLAGRIVRHLEDGVRPAGLHAVAWDGRSDAGSDLSPGFYVIRFESGLVHQTRRVQLIQ